MFEMCKLAAPSMISNNNGKIVNIGSFWAQLGVKNQLAYCASKLSIEALTRCLAVEWAQYNIQINTVAPGHIMTDISAEALNDEKVRKNIIRHIPANRVGQPEEVAYTVLFLCSQEANYITGHTFYVDGGQLIKW